MKTERRHNLETNELARVATVWVEKIKPYANLLTGGLVVLLGMAVASSIWGSISASRQKAAWDAYATAVNSSDMEMSKVQQIATAEAHDGTVMQEWAYVTWANRQLFLASQAYLIDREVAQERLRRAQEIFETLTQTVGDEQLRDRVHFGLAQVYELQNRLDDARHQYDLVLGDLEALARERADHLMDPEVQKTCEWLATAELPRRTLPGAPGGRPEFEAELPDASSVPINLGGRSLEEIFGGMNEGESEDRYGEDSAPAEGESSADASGETPTDETAAQDDTGESDEPAAEDAIEP